MPHVVLVTAHDYHAPMAFDSGVLDFGIARMIDGEVQPGNPHTAHYAAPERIAGEAPSVAAEIFALGILLKRIAGRGDPARPETMRIADRELAAVARRASAAAPRERYSDATALAADLDRWLDRRPVTARRGLLRHIRLATRRHPLAATALPLLLLVAALAAALIVQSHRAARTRFAEERALARYQLTVVDRQLASQPGSLKLRTRRAQRCRRRPRRCDRGAAPVCAAARLRTGTGRRRTASRGARPPPPLGRGALRLVAPRPRRRPAPARLGDRHRRPRRRPRPRRGLPTLWPGRCGDRAARGGRPAVAAGSARDGAAAGGGKRAVLRDIGSHGPRLCAATGGDLPTSPTAPRLHRTASRA